MIVGRPERQWGCDDRKRKGAAGNHRENPLVFEVSMV